MSQKEQDSLGEDWKEKYAHLSRDVGTDILYIALKCEGKLKLINQELFASDSLMNEWSYVIDLDKNQFEVYEGFNYSPVPKKERFSKYNDAKKDYDESRISTKYYPVKLKKIYKLNNLPNKAQFLKDCKPKEDNEE